MICYAATVAYDGSSFAGWQKQSNAISIQEVFEDAVASVIGLSVSVTAAGRTDAGVHSKGQLVSFKLGKEWEEGKLLLALNAHLPPTVRVSRIRKVPEGFNARYSALWREYRYFVWHGNFCYPHIAGYVWWNRKFWDTDHVLKACKILKGEHNFRAFCRVSECPENCVRNIFCLKVCCIGNLTVFRIRGDAFLTNMVRIMIGNIDLIGTGKHDIGWLEELLSGKSRIYSGATAPASGLFLWSVGYDIFSS